MMLLVVDYVMDDVVVLLVMGGMMGVLKGVMNMYCLL